MTNLETKIAALLSKAESTNHPAEAEAFMRKAEELMLKHGIERANLEARENQRQDEIVTSRVHVPNGHGYAAAMAMIAHRTAGSFSVRTLQSNLYRGERVVWFIGYSRDVEQAQKLFGSLATQSRKQALYWWKTEGKALYGRPSDNDAYLARREFIYAFGVGAGDRLSEIRNRTVEEAEAGTSLVLADRRKKVDSWIEENIQTTKGRNTSRRTGGRAARLAGQQAGREAVSPAEIVR